MILQLGHAAARAARINATPSMAGMTMSVTMASISCCVAVQPCPSLPSPLAAGANAVVVLFEQLARARDHHRVRRPPGERLRRLPRGGGGLTLGGVLARGLQRGGQENFEGRAAVRFALDSDHAVVALHDAEHAVDNPKPVPLPTSLVVKKGSKDAFAVGGGNAATGVGSRQRRRKGLVGPGRAGRASARSGWPCGPAGVSWPPWAMASRALTHKLSRTW
jgi:hypothetical protein